MQISSLFDGMGGGGVPFKVAAKLVVPKAVGEQLDSEGVLDHPHDPNPGIDPLEEVDDSEVDNEN